MVAALNAFPPMSTNHSPASLRFALILFSAKAEAETKDLDEGSLIGGVARKPG